MRKALASILFTYTGVGWAPDALKTNKAKASQGCTQWTHNHHTMHTQTNQITPLRADHFFITTLTKALGVGALKPRQRLTRPWVAQVNLLPGSAADARPVPRRVLVRTGRVGQTETMGTFKTRPRRESTGHGTRHDSTWLFRFSFHFYRKWRHRNNF